MNHALIICLLGLASFGLISGHFTMDYPPTRGFMEDDEDKFCGGFPTNATGRHPFPISGPAHVALMAHHGSPKISISISFKHNFTSEAEFNGTELISNAPLPHPGNACFEIDLSNVTSKMTPKPSNGTLATLEVKYDAGGEALYQCSDLVLVQDAAVTNQSLSSCSAGRGSNGGSGSDAKQNAQNSSANSLWFQPTPTMICLSLILLSLSIL